MSKQDNEKVEGAVEAIVTFTTVGKVWAPTRR